MSFERDEIRGQRFDAERALYHSVHTDLSDCVFEGPADGESALKESRDIRIRDTVFSLRYPLWHVQEFVLENSSMDELTRAAIWYASDGTIRESRLCGIKAVRECRRIRIADSHIHSDEFGWKCDKITMLGSELASEYMFLDSRNLTLRNVQAAGKYSFQYTENVLIEDSVLDTKDAFWHSRNVTVKNSVVKGEYLGWYSDGLVLIDCRIIGTQPLCYCTNLTLMNCIMEDADLSFEYSDADARVRGHIDSIKNFRSGKILCDSVGEVIRDDSVMECTGEVILREAAKAGAE